MTKIKTVTFFIIISTLFFSCKLVQKKEYNDIIKNSRDVNILLLSHGVTPLLWNLDTFEIEKMLEIEMRRYDIVGVVLIDSNQSFVSGTIKVKNKYINLTGQNYLEYYSKYDTSSHDLIDQNLSFGDEYIGQLKFIFYKIE